MIGVHGMGGVGKTTLVKIVIVQAIEDKLFDAVVMVDVTENPIIKNIQAQIANELGLTLDKESLQGRAARLYGRLKKEKRVLVVLDNIWAELDLDVIGIPFSEEKKGSVTKDRDFSVDVLSLEEAGNLFWKKINVVDSAQKSDYDSIAIEIVKYYASLPVAIATIANALKNKSLSEWNDALDQLRKSSPRHIQGMDAKVYSAINLSYDFLESEEAKSLFLLSSLHNASTDIHINYFLGFFMGLYLFQDVSTIEQGRNRLHTLINKLIFMSIVGR
ncbi:hypothetical protein EZV62_011030 [Acer yangbiense]|uniref:NB-ARC domain-containing protein n=1 Tax=Acer yangbiense TaxID=1000413 RepID=A0A5C7GP99_9ROSI|nr:hypothetical protein EZV62_027850 [Acer yangbiense]TXG64036.1 hypothetical protein EZV62_011030 [Acer yangbiense]